MFGYAVVVAKFMLITLFSAKRIRISTIYLAVNILVTFVMKLKNDFDLEVFFILKILKNMKLFLFVSYHIVFFNQKWMCLKNI